MATTELGELQIRHQTVLLVEDDPDHEYLARAQLEDGGFHVRATTSLHDGLEMLSSEHEHIDVIVLDLDLPDHDGSNSVELLRMATSTPIIVHSAADAEALRETLRDGADAIVTKAPGAGLLDAVNRVLDPEIRALHVAPGASTDIHGRNDFHRAAGDLVEALGRGPGLDSWLVTRVIDNDWIFLAVHDPHYGLQVGDVVAWDGSFCCRMVEGKGPRIVPDAIADPVYADTPIAQKLDIGAYVGLPIVIDGEGLFGTLCGIQPEPYADPDELLGLLPYFEALVAVLSTCIAVDLDRTRTQRRLDIARVAANRDLLTGAGNRRAWERAVSTEESRCRRFGHQASVLMIDLDGLKAVNDEQGHVAGDRLLRQAATTMQESIRSADQLYRLGGDEFAVLLPETGAAGAGILHDRIADALGRAGVAASIGSASRKSDGSIPEAAQTADQRMYQDKARRRRG